VSGLLGREADLKAVTYRPEITLPVGSEERVLPATWPNGCCGFIIYKWMGELIRINQTQVTLRTENVPYGGAHSANQPVRSCVVMRVFLSR
jgi:hypothetical protein